MPAAIVWPPEAREGILEIAKFISRDSPIRALSVAQSIEAQVENAAIFPNCGSPVREFPNAPIRELIVYNYRVIYLPEENALRLSA